MPLFTGTLYRNGNNRRTSRGVVPDTRAQCVAQLRVDVPPTGKDPDPPTERELLLGEVEALRGDIDREDDALERSALRKRLRAKLRDLREVCA